VVEAITLDGSSIFKSVAEDRIPQARICLDPFHVIGWANEVVESTYRAEAPHFPTSDRTGGGRGGAVRCGRLGNTGNHERRGTGEQGCGGQNERGAVAGHGCPPICAGAAGITDCLTSI